MRRLKLGLIFLVLISGGAYLAHIVRLSYTGYCFAQDKYLSDDEYIRGALSDVTWELKVKDAKSTPEDYVRSHPGCCSVYHQASSWFDNILNSYYVEVELNYELKPEMTKFSGTPFYTTYVSVTACGVAVESFGEGTRTLKTATQYR
ncbi:MULTISPECIES: hypothetical protein [unclassified Marinobacter]|jgi:hypothetical protein|uniref:hypothetical protein n=1 Tax=unclassified Marinobacter TaxID=83889 RepID=UPI00200F3318|nr:MULTISPECIES: hypothetical protein [unclassified Marinobacter]MCL1481097.1 hypothetical protein [Marinobacter sp.]UQG56057.1 hypothetical protein MIH16_22160 [Marinobacter sp. M4C]UQG64861.1 hypothetical protein MIH17_22155 [Marinobacter sp. M2C]UQG69140.1 hypothetical protein MIH19_22165 [Marinobacter sp. M1C]